MQLMLAPNWPGSFRRTVQDDDKLSVVYTFEPSVPIEIPEHHLPALKSDIGKALVVPQPGTSKADSAATRDAIELIDAVAEPPKRKRKSE